MFDCLFYVSSTIFLFGTWAVPVKNLPHDDRHKSFWIALTHFVGSFVVLLAKPEAMPVAEIAAAFFAGMIWGLGNILCFVSLRHLGLTRAFAIWVSGAIIVNLAWGLFYFGEWETMSGPHLQRTVLAVVLVLIAASLVIFSREAEKVSGNFRKGLLAALGLPLFHASYYVPIKSGTASMYASFVPMGLGMLLVTFIFAKSSNKKLIVSPPDLMRLVLAAAMLLLGNYYFINTMSTCGVSKGAALVQFAMVVNTLWGIFYFKEISSARAKLQIFLAVGLMIIGTFMLA